METDEATGEITGTSGVPFDPDPSPITAFDPPPLTADHDVLVGDAAGRAVGHDGEAFRAGTNERARRADAAWNAGLLLAAAKELFDGRGPDVALEALCREGEVLLRERPAGEALFDWLDAFVVHVATKRALALAITGGQDSVRADLFDRWHESMREIAESLLARAKDAGTVRDDLTVGDLLALVSATAIAGAPRARRILRLVRHGIEVR